MGDLHVFGVAALLTLCTSEEQFGRGPEIVGQGVALQNCVGSNCNSNNFFKRQRREVLEKVIARFEEDLSIEERQLLEEILTEVEEQEFSGERTEPNLDSVESSSGLEENPSRFHDLLQQIVGKLDELSLKLGSSSRSSLPTFPTGTKFYTSDGRGGLSAIRAPIISLPAEEVPFENNLARKTQGIRCLKLLDSLLGEAPLENNLAIKTQGIGCLKLLNTLVGEASFENNLATKTQGFGCLKLLDSLVEAPFENNLARKTEGISCLKLLDSLVGEAPLQNNLARKTQGSSCLELLDSLVGGAPFEKSLVTKTQGIGCLKLLDSLPGQGKKEITKLLLKKLLL